MSTITILDGATVRGSYEHRQLEQGGFFGMKRRASIQQTEKRQSLDHDAAGSEVLMFGDEMQLVRPFEVIFVAKGSYAAVEALEQILLTQATSLRHDNTGWHRALAAADVLAPQENVLEFDPIPIRMDSCGLMVWYCKALLAPRFGQATLGQAETPDEFDEIITNPDIPIPADRAHDTGFSAAFS
jgi:hypothetical protein